MLKYFRWLLFALLGLFLLLAAWIIWALAGLPSIDQSNWQVQPPSIRITDRNGQVLYEALTGAGGRNLVVPLSEIPPALRQATVATEDQTFYQNAGVEPVGILRAVWINLRSGETLSGGSTITQQVVRTLLMTAHERSEQSLRRKLREAVLAWQITRRYSKDEILAIYLNQTYYGGMNYGVEAASQTYFGKSVKDLTLAEAALLAGIPQTPAVYNPYTNPEKSLERRGVVLGLMFHQGWITREQYDIASQEPLTLASTPFPLEAPHFVMMVRSQIDSLFTPEQVMLNGGIVVTTSLDLHWQHIAEDAVANQLKSIDTAGQIKHRMNDAAVVVMDPLTGEIKAMVGSPDFFDNRHQGAINMATTARQPGSSIKPIVYALALDPTQPDPWTAATMILDVSTNFLTKEGKSYIPTDYDRQEHGPVLVRQALSSSLNIPAVATLSHVGIDRLADFFQRIGVNSSDMRNADISLALGGGEISLLDLTHAYAVLDHGGCQVNPLSILKIQSGDGTTLYTPAPPSEECVLDKRAAWLITDILSDDSARSLGFPANSILNIGRPAAVKTGTTSNFHDNWTVGYTPQVVVGVWVGNASNEAMEDVTGLSGAGPIWHAVIRNVLAGTPEQEFTRPDGLIQVKICSLSGQLPTPACPYTRAEWFISGTEPTRPDTLYRTVVMDKSTGMPANQATLPENRSEITVLDLPLEASSWAHAHGLALWSDLQQASASMPGLTTEGTPAPAQIEIQSPADGSTYYLSAKIPLADQQIRVDVAASIPVTNMTLWLDGKQIASSVDNPFTTWIQLSLGKHTLVAKMKNTTGEIVSSLPVVFEVKNE